MTTESTEKPSNFLRDRIDEDLADGTHRRVVTRFPPEPNGYLHIGHAKSICLNFGLARDYRGACHLRFDDTNPTRESEEYVRSIQEDVKWLGSHTDAPERGSDFDWGDNLFYASNYFERLYDYAEALILGGKAYVDSLTREEVAAYRGSLTESGRESPYRMRTPEQNLDLFRRMRAGEFDEGEHVLRMKGDMANPNMKMRDLPLYRIMKAHHQNTGDKWCVYPLYDFAHCLSDSIEGITHSICTLEFENNREVYDWLLDNLDVPQPQPRQYEFARLALTYTIMSKRKLLELVEKGTVSGWDDPRMPTVAGLRRRGYTPEAIRAFCDRIGISKHNSMVDVGLLEWALRQDLETRCDRLLGVTDPVKLVITNYPVGEAETLSAPLRPEDGAPCRNVPFSRELWIDRDDFSESPPEGFHRLSPGATVRLRYAYNITCTDFTQGLDGRILEVRASYDPATRGQAADGRKVKGTLHWVSAPHAVPVEVRLYDRLFDDEEPGSGGRDPLESVNPTSLVTRSGFVEPHALTMAAGARVQLERLGYFRFDPSDSRPDHPVLNRTVTLKDGWAKGPAETDPSALRELRRKARAEEKAQSARKGVEASLTDTQAALISRGLQTDQARFVSATDGLLGLFEALVERGAGATAAASLMMIGAQALGDRDQLLSLPVDAVTTIHGAVASGRLTSTGARAAFSDLQAGHSLADALRRNEPVVDLDSLRPAVEAVLARNGDAVQRYRAGNKNLLGFFVGQLMKELGGQADPVASRRLIEELLAGP